MIRSSVRFRLRQLDKGNRPLPVTEQGLIEIMTKKEERQAIYNKTNGKCGYCGVSLEGKFHVDHMEPVHRITEWDLDKNKMVFTGKFHNPENDVFENKIASCPSCNIRKHGSNVDGFRRQLMNTINVLNRDVSAYRFAKRFGLIEESGIVITFYFETLKK